MNSWTNGSVTLRRCSEEDWPLLYGSLQDVQGRYWLQTSVEPLYSEAEAEARWADFLTERRDEGRLDLAVCVDDRPVGVVSLAVQDERCGTFTIPLFILPDYQRLGYARRALELLLDYAFHERRLHKWQASVVADNAASIALHESLGCRLEGRFREQIFHDGTWQDELWYGMTEREWRSATKAAASRG